MVSYRLENRGMTDGVKSLNPYCNGQWSHTYTREEEMYLMDNVLILIVMDNGLILILRALGITANVS